MKEIPYNILENCEIGGGLWVNPDALRDKVLEDRRNPKAVLDYTFWNSFTPGAPKNDPEEPFELDLEKISASISIHPFNTYYLEVLSTVPFGMSRHWTDPMMIQAILDAMGSPCHMVPGKGNDMKVTHGISNRLRRNYCDIVDRLHVSRVIGPDNNLTLQFTHEAFQQKWDDDGLDLRVTLSVSDMINLVLLFFLNIPPKYRTDLQTEKPSDPCLSVPTMAKEDE